MSKYFLFVCISVFILILSPLVGPSREWSIYEFVFGDGVASQVFWQIRIPRVLLAFIAGASLGSAGLCYQALFRNPLASPYTFGVASGASLGAVLTITLGLTSSILGVSTLTLGGIVGSLLVTFLVYKISSRSLLDNTMLLAGVAMSFFCSSLILFLQYLSDFEGSFQIMHWLMGGLAVVGYDSVVALLPFVLVGIYFVLKYRKELDLFTLGDELALSYGVDVTRVRRKLFFATSIMVGAVVSFTGPIGFVGIMVPHICKLILKSTQQKIAAMVVLASGSFLVASDALARTILSPSDVPVGVITALLGGPFFIAILLRKT